MTPNIYKQPADAGQMFTDTTAAEYIGGIEPRTIRAWRTNKGLPFLKITSKVCRIRKSDLDAWLAKSRVATIRGGVR